MTLTLSTQLGIVAMGIIFAVGGILYAINYDFTPILDDINRQYECLITNSTCSYWWTP